MQTFPTHPLADAFPLIEGPAFDELVASIKEYGLREPITLLDGAVLDGRNRLRACEAGEVEPRFETYTGDNAAAFVIDKNINRRHLNASQRAMVAAALVTYQKGRPRNENLGMPRLKRDEAAARLDVSPDMVTDALAVLARGTEQEIAQLKDGKGAVSSVADQIRQGIEPEKREVHKPKAKRNGTQQMHAEVWQTFKTAVLALTDLPRVEDTVPIIWAKDQRNGFIAERLPAATEYLREFLNAWNNANAH